MRFFKDYDKVHEEAELMKLRQTLDAYAQMHINNGTNSWQIFHSKTLLN